MQQLFWNADADEKLEIFFIWPLWSFLSLFKSRTLFFSNYFFLFSSCFISSLPNLVTTCPLTNKYNPVCPWLGDDMGRTVCCFAEGPSCCYPGGTNCTDKGAVKRNYCPRPWEANDYQLCCDVNGKAACCKPHKENLLFRYCSAIIILLKLSLQLGYMKKVYLKLTDKLRKKSWVTSGN